MNIYYSSPENKERFSWYPQSWSGKPAHLVDNKNALKEDMALNQRFASEHSLPLSPQYGVPVAESGVFPLLASLYQAWTEDGRINVTSCSVYNDRNSIGHVARGFRVREMNVSWPKPHTHGLMFGYRGCWSLYNADIHSEFMLDCPLTLLYQSIL